MNLKNELRRGNVIIFDDDSEDIVKVKYIFKSSNSWFVKWKWISGKGSFSKGDSLLDDFLPLKLTEDRILAMGFKKCEGEDKIYEELKLSDFDKVYWIGGMYFLEETYDNSGQYDLYRCTDEDTYMLLKTVDYVHQVQNICQDLTNKQIKYKP